MDEFDRFEMKTNINREKGIRNIHKKLILKFSEFGYFCGLNRYDGTISPVLEITTNGNGTGIIDYEVVKKVIRECRWVEPVRVLENEYGRIRVAVRFVKPQTI